jgi:hypothetical protein
MALSSEGSFQRYGVAGTWHRHKHISMMRSTVCVSIQHTVKTIAAQTTVRVRVCTQVPHPITSERDNPLKSLRALPQPQLNGTSKFDVRCTLAQDAHSLFLGMRDEGVPELAVLHARIRRINDNAVEEFGRCDGPWRAVSTNGDLLADAIRTCCPNPNGTLVRFGEGKGYATAAPNDRSMAKPICASPSGNTPPSKKKSSPHSCPPRRA